MQCDGIGTTNAVRVPVGFGTYLHPKMWQLWSSSWQRTCEYHHAALKGLLVRSFTEKNGIMEFAHSNAELFYISLHVNLDFIARQLTAQCITISHLGPDLIKWCYREIVLSPQWDFLYWYDNIFILNQCPSFLFVDPIVVASGERRRTHTWVISNWGSVPLRFPRKYTEQLCIQFNEA